jgi:WD40 repeat protein
LLFVTIKNASIQSRALQFLAKLTSQVAIDQLWAVWETTRQPHLATLLLEQPYLATAPLKVRVLSMLLSQKEAYLDKTELATVGLLIEICRNELDLNLARRANSSLQEFEPSMLTAYLPQSSDYILPLLLADLTTHQAFMQRHVAGWRVLVALRVARPALLTAAEPSVLAPLLELHDSSDSQLAASAYNVLLNLTASATKDSLCRLALEPEQPLALALVSAADYQPSNTHERALFLFLTQQWQRYESLDFDQSLLKFIFEASDTTTRQRVLDTARINGRAELVLLLTGGSQSRRLQSMSVAEWTLVLDLLVNKQRWDEAWGLVLYAPPLWGMQLLRQMVQTLGVSSAWQPVQPAEQALYAQLKLLADDWNNAYPPQGDYPPLGRQLKIQTVLASELGQINAMVSTPTGDLVVTGSQNGAIQLWNATTKRGWQLLDTFHEQITTLQMSGDLANESPSIRALAINPTKPNLIACESGRWTTSDKWVGNLCLRDTTDWQQVVVLEEQSELNTNPYYANSTLATDLLLGRSHVALDFSPDGQILASCRKDELTLWNVKNGTVLKRLNVKAAKRNAGYLLSVKFSPDGKLLATNTQADTILLWRVSDGQFLKSLVVRPVFSGYYLTTLDRILSFSSDGRTLISTNLQGHIQLWNLPNSNNLEAWTTSTSTSQPLAILYGHYNGVYAIALSPDGQILATGHDKMIRLWYLPTRQPLKTIKAHRSEVTGLVFSSDGQQLISSGLDGRLLVWSTRLSELCQQPQQQTKISDLLFARQSQRDPCLTETERYWLLYLETLLGWQYQHEIEVSDFLPTEASEFDIILDTIEKEAN